jgi:hypothetical protein
LKISSSNTTGTTKLRVAKYTSLLDAISTVIQQKLSEKMAGPAPDFAFANTVIIFNFEMIRHSILENVEKFLRIECQFWTSSMTKELAGAAIYGLKMAFTSTGIAKELSI